MAFRHVAASIREPSARDPSSLGRTSPCKLPASTRLAVLGNGLLTMSSMVAALHAEGHRLLLTEGGLTMIGQLISEKLLGELFLTTAPALFGRTEGDGRKALVEGVDVFFGP